MSEHFFIIGAQRCGTTYLYHLLAEHPEIDMAQPVRPEPKFFLRDDLYAQGIDYYERHYFSGKAGAWLKGEKTTSYIESVQVARRLATHFPYARIVILLRDPIQRAISNYWFSVTNGFETWPLEQALRADATQRSIIDRTAVSTNPFDYLRRGRYMDFIRPYEDYFPPEQIVAVLYEQLVDNLPQVQALYSFLGVASCFLPAGLHEEINAGEKQETLISPSLGAYLVDYYAEANGRLAARFGFELANWWSSCR